MENNEMPTPTAPLTDEQKANMIKEFRKQNSDKSLTDLRKQWLNKKKEQEKVEQEGK